MRRSWRTSDELAAMREDMRALMAAVGAVDDRRPADIRVQA